jgi:transposase InsO family protein
MAIYSFIAEEQADPDSDWTVAECCRALGVSRSGYYAWVSRDPGPREVSDRVLAREIEAIWECSDRTYGGPRVWRWLLKEGYTVGRNRVARIMRANGWEGETGRHKIRTTIVDRTARAATDRPAGLQPARPGSDMVRRHHLSAHRRGLAVLGHGHRPVLQAGHRLVGRFSHAHQPGR